MKRTLIFIGKLIISGALIYVLLRKIPFADVAHSWGMYSAGAIIGVIALYLLAILINALKWKTFLPEQPFMRLLQFTFIDCFYGMVLPGQFSGEVAKSFRLGVRTGDTKRVVVSVWLDKLTGMAGLITLMFIGLIVSHRHFPLIIYVIVFALFLLCLLGIALFRRHEWDKLIVLLKGKSSNQAFHSALAKGQGILEAFRSYPHSTRLVTLNIFLGALYQLAAICFTVVLARQLGIMVPFTDWFWIFGLVSIIQFIPISIAGLGVREASFVGILALYAVPATAALSLSLSVFCLQAIFALIGAAVEVHYTVSRHVS